MNTSRLRKHIHSSLRGNHLWTGFLFSILLASCTLTMEDWVLQDEERGKDEPYTEHTEYGDITYQYQDSVQPITDRIQEDYIVRVEHDSILYINGDIPSKWRPYVGMKMATGCSHLLPYGLNHRVISVEDVGGILKVVTTRVDVDEVFKQLDYCLDVGLGQPDLGDMTAEELLDYGYEMTIDPETGDTLIMDWNEYDVAKGLRPAKAKRRSLKRMRMTRADDDDWKDAEEQTGDASGVDKTVLFDLFVDTRFIKTISKGAELKREFTQAIIDDLIKKKNGNYKDMAGEFYAGVGLDVISYSRAHMEKDEATETDVEYVDSWTEIGAKAEVGFDLNKKSFVSEDDRTVGIPSKMFREQLVAAGRKGIKLGELTKREQKISNSNIRIILPTNAAMAILIGSNISPVININGSICGSLTFTTKKTRSGYEIRNGKKLHEWKNEEVEKGSSPKWQCMLNGSFKIGASFRAYVGLEFARAVSTTIGLNVDAFVEASASYDLTPNGTDFFSFDRLSGDFNAYVTIYGDIKVAVAPFGIELMDKQLATFLKKELFRLKGTINPILTSPYGTFIVDDVANDNLKFSGSYTISDMGMGRTFFSTDNGYPGMRLYFGPVKSSTKSVYMQPCDEKGQPLDFKDLAYAKEGVKYYFMWKCLG